ncbi:MAG: trehalose-phosphatase [Desulfurivibrionaceae bacterium]
MVCEQSAFNISKDKFEGILFDLDGVVTKTAKVHAASWKQLFDDYLEGRAGPDEKWRPFDLDSDYSAYVDGKPRYDGVESFLKSRGIALPFGNQDDPVDAETICGLGNKKNQIFNEHLQRHGVELYEIAVELIRLLKKNGFKTGVVSSSKNCRTVLKAAGIEELFDVRVDGVVSEQLGLNGKPAPDIFLEAARRLETPPARAIVLEDALSGVQAGRSGHFGCVIGVDRNGRAEALQKQGADIVVKVLSELTVEGQIPLWQHDMEELPSALASLPEIRKLLSAGQAFIALDYDGTLTPIVESPELAILSDEMRDAVAALADKSVVAIISGRDLSNVKKLVSIDSLFYAGSHGFDISGPAGRRLGSRQGVKFLPVLDRAEQKLRTLLDNIPGILVERKKFSIAVHFRKVAEQRLPEVEAAVAQVLASHAGLRRTSGKKIFELQPEIDWHKGKALCWLMEALDLNRPGVLPFYLGDDLTDEDAFGVLQSGGIGVVVKGDEADAAPRPSRARYVLEDCRQVRDFLEALSGMLQEKTDE